MSDIAVLETIFFVVSSTLLIAAVFLFRSTKRFLKSAKTASGIVLENVCQTDADGDPYFCPRFSFKTAEGQEIVVQSCNGTNPASFRVKQSVTVLYDLENPEDARINSFGQLWLGPIVFGIVGGVFLGIDLFFLVHGF